MDANLKREKPADMLRVEAAYCGDEIVGLRITADDPARQLLVWADNSVMNGFRIGNEFIAGWDKKIEYRDVAIGEPEPAAPAAPQGTAKVNWWESDGDKYDDPITRAQPTTTAQAAPAAGAVAGPDWKLVPVKPTPEMLRAGDQKTWVLPALDCWRAMLAAAPTPAAQADSQPAAVLEGDRYLDAWKCERCHGKGWHWQSESVNHGKEIGVENVDLKTHCDACEGCGWCGPDADHAARAPADSVPNAQFDDPKVQIVYAILCENAKPPEGEHWEGFAARRIVDALFKESVRDGQNH